MAVGPAALVGLFVTLGASGLMIAAFLPGLLTTDTVWFLQPARMGRYDDGQALILAATWHIGPCFGLGLEWVLTATVLLFVASMYSWCGQGSHGCTQPRSPPSPLDHHRCSATSACTPGIRGTPSSFWRRSPSPSVASGPA
jgi:hypothetical protein